MSIRLSKENEQFVQNAVRAGRYANEDEVVDDALDQLRKQSSTPSLGEEPTFVRRVAIIINDLAHLELDDIQNSEIVGSARQGLREDESRKIAELALLTDLSIDEIKKLVLKQKQRVVFGGSLGRGASLQCEELERSIQETLELAGKQSPPPSSGEGLIGAMSEDAELLEQVTQDVMESRRTRTLRLTPDA